MTAAGWGIMMTSVGGVVAWCGYCLYRVLTLPPAVVEEHMKAPLDIDSGDLD